MKILELIVAGDHRPLQEGRAYTLTPVTEDAGDGELVLMGYQVFDVSATRPASTNVAGSRRFAPQ